MTIRSSIAKVSNFAQSKRIERFECVYPILSSNYDPLLASLESLRPTQSEQLLFYRYLRPSSNIHSFSLENLCSMSIWEKDRLGQE